MKKVLIIFLHDTCIYLGNISAGKSTLCRELASELGYTLFLEPVVTNPYLELYYGDAVKYGLDMQLWLLRQRFIMYCRAIRALEETTTDANGATKVKGVVLDRSLMSDVVFADKVNYVSIVL
jgi:deoxyadenosine/deoxycytidine kinase